MGLTQNTTSSARHAATVAGNTSDSAARARALPWWAKPELWWDDSDFQRPLEREVFRRLFWAAWRMVHGPERGPLSHREAILRPLREIHAARGQRLEWVNVGKGQVVSVLVDIDA